MLLICKSAVIHGEQKSANVEYQTVDFLLLYVFISMNIYLYAVCSVMPALHLVSFHHLLPFPAYSTLFLSLYSIIHHCSMVLMVVLIKPIAVSSSQ